FPVLPQPVLKCTDANVVMFTEFFLSLLAGFVFFHQGKHLVGGTAYTSMYFTHVISFYKDLTPTRILQYVVSRTDTFKTRKLKYFYNIAVIFLSGTITPKSVARSHRNTHWTLSEILNQLFNFTMGALWGRLQFN